VNANEPAIHNIDLAPYTAQQRAVMEDAMGVMANTLFWDRDEICRVTGRDWSTLTRFYQGKPQGDTAAVVADLARLAAQHAHARLVVTPIVEDYLRVLHSCKRDGRMGAMVAKTGRGKSSTLAYFRTRFHPRATIITCPSKCSRADLTLLICDGLGIDTSSMNEPARERALFARITPRDMLLVDEAGYLVTERRRTSPLRLLQDIHDHCHCPVVLAMRPHHWGNLVSGRTACDDEQLLGRILHRSIVRCGYKKEEIEAIVGVYHQGPVTRGMTQVIKATLGGDIGGIRALCYDLASAASQAAETGIPFETAFLGAATLRETSAHIAKLEDFGAEPRK
jgi:hypothetical protein